MHDRQYQCIHLPAGKVFNLDLADKMTVNMLGDVTFGNKTGPASLFQITGNSITFSGNGHTFDGNGPFNWDGQGTDGGFTKPHPLMKIKISGSWNNVKVLNSPAQTYSISYPGPLVMSKLTIDDSADDAANSASNGRAAGPNTDGFDASTTNLTIENSFVPYKFWHDKHAAYAFPQKMRLRAVLPATKLSASKLMPVQQMLQSIMSPTPETKAAVIVASVSSQSYPSTLGTPGTGVAISDINFTGGETSPTVNSGAKRVAAKCGSGTCSGEHTFSFV
ncbi:hypothetical protein EW146_g6639 [Bondarzewia mesenterica]|uniref:Uncharacterized protein n=1 Tax=Bondarzewia mesenterica TaxID=1095465 RepID=A0A4S4LTN1_9AGAM|nr:hypothetical protein EW146_g6639 [Bondarzewia mesenterica]